MNAAHRTCPGHPSLAYSVYGEGPTVVLLQGIGLPGAMWLDLPEHLAREGLRVVVPDARGTGSSDAPPPPYHMRDMAADVARLLDHLRSEPAIVVGISFGGMVAQRFALDHPHRLRGLVLAATACGARHHGWPGPSFVSLLLRSMGPNPERALELTRQAIVHPESLRKNPRLFDEWDRVQSSLPMPWQGTAGHLMAAALHHPGRELRRITSPTTVVVGAGDRVFGVRASEKIASLIPDAELMVVPKVGHAFPIEAPEVIPEAVRRVRRRLGELPTSSASGGVARTDPKGACA